MKDECRNLRARGPCLVEESRSGIGRRGMAAADGLFPPNREGERAVHAQSGHRGATRRGEAKNANAIPAEMTAPYFAAWMEERQHFASGGVRCLLAGAFAQRARDASQREVVQGCHAADGHRNDMVHMEEGFLSRLR